LPLWSLPVDAERILAVWAWAPIALPAILEAQASGAKTLREIAATLNGGHSHGAGRERAAEAVANI
jgi:hypothetical protein